MTNYFELRISSAAAGRCVFGTPTLEGSPINPWIFSECRPWQGSGRLKVSFFRPGWVAGFNMDAYGIWFIKPEIAGVLKRMTSSHELEMIPCDTEDGSVVLILNPLFAVDCLDLINSRNVRYYDSDDPTGRIGIQGIREIFILPKMAAGRHIFRIHGYTLPLVVSDVVRNALGPPEVLGIAFNRLKFESDVKQRS